MVPDTPAASGRNETTTPPATALAAKIRDGRSCRPCRRADRIPAESPVPAKCSCPAAAGRAGQPREHGQRNERAHGGDADNDRVAVVASEPDADWQGYDFRHAGHDPERAQSFASPFGWQQRGREGTGRDTGEAEAEAANDADRHRDDQRASRQQHQGRYAQ
jgi:hypothetical protein